MRAEGPARAVCGMSDDLLSSRSRHRRSAWRALAARAARVAPGLMAFAPGGRSLRAEGARRWVRARTFPHGIAEVLPPIPRILAHCGRCAGRRSSGGRRSLLIDSPTSTCGCAQAAAPRHPGWRTSSALRVGLRARTASAESARRGADAGHPALRAEFYARHGRQAVLRGQSPCGRTAPRCYRRTPTRPDLDLPPRPPPGAGPRPRQPGPRPLPGSRRQEIPPHLAGLLAAARLLRSACRTSSWSAGGADRQRDWLRTDLPSPSWKGVRRGAGGGGRGGGRSGTATLEAALAQVLPWSCTALVAQLDRRAGCSCASVRLAGEVLAGRRLVPELLASATARRRAASPRARLRCSVRERRGSRSSKACAAFGQPRPGRCPRPAAPGAPPRKSPRCSGVEESNANRACVSCPPTTSARTCPRSSRPSWPPRRSWERARGRRQLSDGTGAVADELAGRIRACACCTARARKGSQGIFAGFDVGPARRVRADLGKWTPDFSHEPERLPALLAASGEADLVLAAATSRARDQALGPRRRVLSRGGSLYARTILGVRVRDLTGGSSASARGAGTHRSADRQQRRLRLPDRADLPRLARGVPRRGGSDRLADRRVGQSKMSRSIVLEALWKVWLIRAAGWRPGA